MKLWHMRGPELADPAERHALLADLVEELQDREPELLVLIRKMVEMIDEAEGELERETSDLHDQIEQLEYDLAAAEDRVTNLQDRYDEAKYDADHWEAEFYKLQEGKA